MGKVACVFTFFKGNGPAACKEAYDFCYNVCGARPAWPLLGLYYKHWNGKELKAGYSLGNSPNVPAFKNYVTTFLSQVNKLKKDEPEPDPDAKPPEEEVVPGDATFACGNTEKARLEAMPSTEQVYVPIIKTLNLNVETTNQVVVIGIPTPDATNAAVAVTNEIVWTAETNATSLVQEIPVPKLFWASNTNWTGAAAITVELRGTNGVLNAKTAITLVEEQPASPLFPKWIGENFGFGEWTLDFDAATNKVFAANTDDVASYTLVMVGGGLWCPDCKSCESSLVGKSEFTAWAKSNNVALVVSDQPELDTEAASLVTHNIGKMDASSGSYYLSRKGLTIAQGSEQFAAMTNRSYNLWKKDQTAVRVANPTFILFRNDGTIAGRLQESRIEDPRVADNKEEYSLEENLARLNDLLKMAKDSTANGLTEEANDALETTPLEIAFEGETSEVTLQVNDVCDYVRVTGLPSETYFDLDLADDPEVCSNANFKAELMVWNGSAYVPLNPEKQNTWKMNVEQASTNVYLKFSAYEDARYTLYGSNTAFSVGFSMLEMQPDAGEIALTETGVKIVEGQKTNIVISAERSVWHSGSVTGYLHVVTSDTTAQPYRFGWPTNALGEYLPQALVWEDGEIGVKSYSLPLLNDPVWDGDEKITVRLEAVGEVTAEDGRAVSIAAGADKWELTIYEDDPKESGKIALSPENSEPAATKQNIVFAKENTTVKLAVERIDGSHGEASVCLSATGGTLLDERLTWSSKDIENVKYARFVLPALKGGQSQATCYVTLKKDCNVPLVSSASRIQIRVLPNDAPVFTTDRELCEGVQSVKMEKIIYLNSELPEGAVVTLSRISGSIPAGVTVRYDKDLKAIVISGIPSGYGDFLASYQLIVRAGGKATYSMPVTVDFNLASRAEIVPALAKACAFTDLPVLGHDGKTLEGLLDVTLPVSGRLSAKYRTIEGKSVAMTANGWKAIAEGTASAEFTANSGYRMNFSLSDENSVVAEISGSGFTNSVQRSAVPLWSTENKASGYQGVYTIEIAPTNKLEGSAEPLCDGAASVSLKLNSESAYRTGRMIFTGILPNGKTVNGTSTLIPSMAGTFAEMPLFAASSSDAVSGIILVTNGLHQTHTNGNLKAVRCRQDVDMVWLHIEPRLPASYSYGVDCSVWGTYLPSGMDWGERWQRDFGTSNLWFAVDGTAERTCLIASGKTVKIKDVKQNPLNLTFSLNASTGIARGTVRVEGRTYSWSGAFLGDWHECGSCGNEVETTRPLLFGNFWTQVLDTYSDEAGRSRKASIRIGDAVMIDKLENLESN